MSDDNRLDLNVSNTVTNTHTYTIDWQPDYITWAVDGEVQRTKLRNETYNSTSGQYHFPQTPSRIQLSLWPAGLASNGNGTIEWAGGLVDWSSEYMQNGYYYAMIKEVTVECYDPPTGYINDGTKSYYYTTTAGTNDTVAITNNSTILSSLYATGENPTYDPDASSSATGTKTTTKTATATPETVPGVSGAGGASEGSNSDSSNSDTASSVSSAAASASTSSSSSSGFSQGTSSDTTNAGAKVAAGSFVAFIGFLIAAMML
ncbi:putative glycosidase CRH2 [Zalaria obscura]|uniref:Glycosidase CRH2 n=1 Tax=Zalaria obscura TaxID=2024903 RepID=A0ACC3S752_9PEZI